MERIRDTVMPGKRYTDKKENRILSIIWDFLVMSLFQAGVICQMKTWFQLDSSQALAVGIWSGVVTVFMVVLFRLTDRERYSYILAVCALLLAAVINSVESVYYGLFGMVNYMISWWNISHEDAATLVMEDRITSGDIYACAVVVILIMVLLWWGILRRKRVLAAVVMVLALIILGLVVDSYSLAGCGVMAAGWLGLMMSGGDRRVTGRNVAWLVVMTVLFLVTAVLPGTGRQQDVVDIKEQADEAVQHLRYGEDTLPEGDLSRADELLDGDSDTLVVTSEEKKDIYLKGFVGSRYADGKWSELSAAEYKGDRSGMMFWLSDRGFMPVDQYSAYTGADPEQADRSNLVTVKNVGANRKYIYAPYSADIPEGTLVNVNEDMNYRSMGLFGAKEYRYSEYSTDRPGELLYAAAWVNAPQDEAQESYVEAENVYADFVYDRYLSVDDEMAQMINSVFYSDDWESDGTIYSVTERIRDVLAKRAVYREKPEAVPDGNDPVAWFLNGGHEGNSVLYASAGVLAFRAQGIPARYVEGYRLSGDRMNGSSGSEVTLTNKDSHAWIEVYLDSVGWVPIDVTPGFYYDTYTLLQMVQRPQNVNQSVFNDDSSNQGNEMDSTQDNGGSTDEKDEKQNSHNVPLDILLGIVLVCVLAVTAVEVRYFVRRLDDEKKYDRLPDEEKVSRLSKSIFFMMELYGCKAGLGWEAAETDAQLADMLPGFYAGEYLRITEILEKSIYGQEELAQAELRTLYIFAEKLYDARKSVGFVKRLRIRYGV